MERDRVFRRVWLCLGREERIPNPGDFFVKDLAIARTSVIVVRGLGTGQPAAFNPLCLWAGSFGWRLLAEVTSFDIVTIEVEYERGVVIVAVLAPKARRPIILRARLERYGMELMHGLFA